MNMRTMRTEKRRKLPSRMLAWLTAFAMIVCLLPANLWEAEAATNLRNPTVTNNGDGTSTTTWDCVYFGSYPQSADGSGGFKTEPIKWRVLSVNGNDAFLLADLNLDCQPYNTEYVDVTWENCTLRSWLNSNFIDKAFSSAEQNAIYTTSVVNEDNPEYGTEGGNDTHDKVYLLSIGEATNISYGFDNSYNSSGTREAKNTGYVASYSNMSSEGATDWWWLRSPGTDSNNAAHVSNIGIIYCYGTFVDNDCYAVRPALHLNLSSDLWSYAGTVSSDGTVNEEAKPSAPSTDPVTEDDLFGEQWAYLNNDAYNEICNILENACDDILLEYDDEKVIRSAKKYTLTAGPIENLRNIFFGLLGRNITQEEIEEELALELLQAVDSNSNIAAEVVEDVKDAYGWTSTTYGIVSDGFKNASDKKKIAEIIDNGVFADNERDALELIKDLESEWDQIDKIFKAAGVSINVAEAAVYITMAMDVNQEMINIFMENIGSENALYRGLGSLKKKQKKAAAQNIVEKFLENGGFELMADAGLDLAGKAVKYIDFGFKIWANIIVREDTADDLYRAMCANTTHSVLDTALLNKQISISDDYDAGKLDMATAKKEYELLQVIHLQSIKSMVDHSLKIANGSKKTKLQRDYTKYKPYLSYEQYMASCLQSASAGWTYEVFENKATITGFVGNNGGGGARTVLMNNARSSLNVVSYTLSIPDEIDGYTVVGINDNAFKGNTQVKCVYVPETVENLGDNVFDGCSNLDTVFFRNGLVSIGANAFNGCNSLNHIQIPYSVETIGENAFSNIDDITLIAPEGSAAQMYADGIDNIDFENRELAVTNITVKQYPTKQTYGMSERLDTTGLVIEVVYEDGSTKDISEGIYCAFEEKQIGYSIVSVNYFDCQTSYEVEVTADECQYTVFYRNEYGEEIADRVTGKAMAGTEVSLPIPEIEGYTADESEVKVTIGDYNEFIVTYTSNAKSDLNDAEINYTKEFTYSGNLVKPAVTVTYKGKKLIEGQDYFVDYDEIKSLGEGTILICGMGDYTGIVTKTFTITRANISGKTAVLSSTAYTYDGKAKTPTVTISGLESGTDFTVSYSNNINAGTATVTITGKGNYTGTITKTFTINKASIKDKTVKLSATSYTYNGSAKKPSVTISGLKSGTHFTVSYKNNKYPGTATATITGKGNYTGTITKSFTIKKPFVAAPKTVSVRLVKGDYDAIYASWSKVKVTGTTVKYKVQYKVGSGKWKTAKNSGTTKNYCTLKGLADGKKCYVKVTPYVTVNKKNHTASGKNSAAIYTLKKLNKPTVKKASKTKVKVSWKNISGESGYEIYKSTKKTKGFKLAKRVTSTKAKSTTFKVTKKKMYYYKVRAFKTIKISDKSYRVYGPWSAVRSYKLK